MIFYSIIYHNNILIDYIIKHAELHNIILFCYTSTNTSHIACYDNMFFVYKNKLDLIRAQDATVKFRLSLRYIWITGCMA